MVGISGALSPLSRRFLELLFLEQVLSESGHADPLPSYRSTDVAGVNVAIVKIALIGTRRSFWGRI